MNELEIKKMFNLVDTIDGEINRMCVTHDLSELDTMAMHAKKNIDKLLSIRFIADFRRVKMTTEEAIKTLERRPAERSTSIHEYVEDFINCTNKETCQECKCETEGDYFICALLQVYREYLIERFTKLS